jgi:murein DD-endopeptidase MepM/ murein hydrolase activator NlpD
MLSPISDLKKRRINKTLHGRSVYRPRDVPGHNVFLGYSTWAANGHVGVGDGLDLFAVGGAPVYAPFDGVQTRWLHDATRLEVIYLERADGATAVLAHVNAKHEGTGIKVQAGEIVGWVRKDLSDPHLHFELRMPGPKPLTGKTPAQMKKALLALCGIK